MGYESRLYLGEPGHRSHEGQYVQVVAMVDLCKVDYDGQLYRYMRSTRAACKTKVERGLQVPFYAYVDSRDESTSEDCYGDPLTPLDVEVVIDHMEAAHADEPYRRYAVALPLLRAWRDSQHLFADPVLLHYGY